MSTATSTAPVTIDTTRPGVPFARLLKVEFRKMFDTRASRWLVISTAILLVLVTGIALLVVGLNDNASISSSDWYLGIMVSVLSLLLPVFAILSVTGEWGQRSHLTLFTLEPRRARVVTAKLVAVTSFALLLLVVAFALSAVGNVLGAAVGGYDALWNYDLSETLWTVVAQLAYFWMAFGLGALVLSTPIAIVIFYVVGLLLPFMVYGPLVSIFEWARDIVPLVDINYAIVEPMTGEDFVGNPVDVGAVEYLRVLSPIVIWSVIPLVLGYLRIMRDEVK